MKKLLLLIALILSVSAMWNGAVARYVLGVDRIASKDIKAGDLIAIQGISDAANNGYRYIAGVKLQKMFTEDCVFEVEEGPADLRTGDPTIFLRNVVTNKYFGKDGLRGKSAGSWKDQKLVSTPDSAYNFALYSAADSSEVWNGQQNFDATSVVFCYSYQDNSEPGYQFICNWGYFDEDQIMIWGYHDTNPWDVYAVSNVNDPKGELEDLINYYEEIEFTPGTDPGFYPTDLAKAYQKALEAAVLGLQVEHSDAEYQELLDNLKAAKAAVESAYIEITDGYYYVVCAYSDFYTKQGIEMGCFVDNNQNFVQWKAIDENDPAFLFKFTKKSDGNFSVQSYNNEKYWTSAAESKSSQGIQINAKESDSQIFESIGSGQWVIYNTKYNMHYHPESHGGGAGKNGKLVTWNTTGLSSGSTWYVRSVKNPNLVDSLDQVKIQNKLTAELQAACSDASATYNKLFVYNADKEQPLITNVTDGDPEDCQLSSNASDGSEGQHLSYLIDNDPTTFWHSTYHQAEDPGTYHYLMADISNNPQKSFQIFMSRRQGSYGNYDRPTAVNIYVTNDTIGMWNGTANWVLAKAVTGLPTASEIEDFSTPGIEIETEASYIRMDVIEKSNDPSRNLNGWPYFNLSEFQIYPVAIDKNASQYYYIAGMKEVADALDEMTAAAREKVAANTATQEDIEALKAATKAVEELFADTTALKNLITGSINLANGTQIGEGIGQAQSQETIDALLAAAEEAKKANTGAVQLDKEALDAAYDALKEARTTFYKSLNLPKEDAWYYIASLDESRDQYLDSEEYPGYYTKGSYIYVTNYGADQKLTWDAPVTEETDLNYNPMAMWHFIPVEDETYALSYYIQNLGTGLYIGDYPTYSVAVKTSKEPVLYQLNISGGQPGLIARYGENPGYSLHAATSGREIVGWSAGAKSPSAWDIIEVNADEIDAFILPTHNNNIDVFAVPYEYNIMENNDNATTYAIKKMTLDPETDETTIELYIKEEFAAGEPCILVIGDPASDEEDEETDLVLPLPTTIAQQMIPDNGLVGLLTTEKIPLGAAWFTGKEIENKEASISAHTGYIDATLYKGEVEGVDTEMTLTITGLNWPETPTNTGDVDGDGKINTADVVAVYNIILGTGTGNGDVDGDGKVNTADVVAIYNLILNGGTAAAPGFVAADGPVKMTIKAEAGPASNIPVTISLSNETPMSALEARLKAPEGTSFVYDEDEDEYTYENTARWAKSHAAMINVIAAGDDKGKLLVSIASSKSQNFKESEGEIIRVFLNAEGLVDGVYNIECAELLAVESNGTSHNLGSASVEVEIKDGKCTAVESITAEQLKAAKAIYTIDGKAVAQPVKGQIYVVDGKTVKF